MVELSPALLHGLRGKQWPGSQVSYKDPKWDLQVGAFPRISPNNVCYSGENSRYADAKNNVIAFTQSRQDEKCNQVNGRGGSHLHQRRLQSRSGRIVGRLPQLYRDHRRQRQLLGCRFAHRAEQRCLGRYCRGHTLRIRSEKPGRRQQGLCPDGWQRSESGISNCLKSNPSSAQHQL